MRRNSILNSPILSITVSILVLISLVFAFQTIRNTIAHSRVEAATLNASGLPWSSGMSEMDYQAFGTWRGRTVDNTTVWPNRYNWNELSHPDIYGAISSVPADIYLTIALAMLPEDGSASFATCATGAYDQYYQTYGSELVRLGRGDSTIRLGWEANGDWYAWSMTSDPTDYVACFRKEVAALRSTAPNVKIDWNMNKDSKIGSTSVVEGYPGDDVVDIIGVDFYDWYPSYPTQTAWDNDYYATQNGGPRGIGSWLQFAKAHGKKFSVPEWGVRTAAEGGGDNPFFINAMYNFFQTNAADIAYETYFNVGESMIYPDTNYPLAAAKYKELWEYTPTPTQVPTSTPTITPTPTQGVGPNILQNASFENGKTPWYLSVVSPAGGTFSRVTNQKVDGVYSARINVTSNSSNKHYVQLRQDNLTLVEGETYTLSFWAKASKNRQIDYVLQRMASPYTVYLSNTVSLTTAWNEYTISYTPSETTQDIFLGFNLAQTTGYVWIDNVSLTTSN